MAKFKPGQSGNPAGKPKGCVNKTTREVRDAILRVFDPKDFEAWAKKNKNLFYTQILTRLLPREMRLDGNRQLVIEIRDCSQDIAEVESQVVPCLPEPEGDD